MKDDKLNRILEVARHRFLVYGIKKTTMQEIATEAEMAVGTLYLYFKNKNEIVKASVKLFIERHQEEEQEALNSKLPPDQRLLNYMLARFKAAKATRGNPHSDEMTRKVLKLFPKRMEEEGIKMFGVLSTLLQEGCKKKIFHLSDIEETIYIFLYATAFFFPLATDEFRIEPEEKDFIKVIQWFLAQWKKK